MRIGLSTCIILLLFFLAVLNRLRGCTDPNILRCVGDFTDSSSSGFTCKFYEWTRCVEGHGGCHRCNIDCSHDNSSSRRICHIGGGVFLPLSGSFTLPPHTDLVGAANPNTVRDEQQRDFHRQSWIIVPSGMTFESRDQGCLTTVVNVERTSLSAVASNITAIFMNDNTTLQNINMQDASTRGRSEGGQMCPALIHLPGLHPFTYKSNTSRIPLSVGRAVHNVQIKNVRLNDAIPPPESESELTGQSAFGFVPLMLLPGEAHSNVYVEGMHISRTDADGVNIHGAVAPLVFTDSFIRNTGNDCFAVWSADTRATVTRLNARACRDACVSLFAWNDVVVDGLTCDMKMGASERAPAPITLFDGFILDSDPDDPDNECAQPNASLQISNVVYNLSSGRPPCQFCYWADPVLPSCSTPNATMCSLTTRIDRNVSHIQDVCLGAVSSEYPACKSTPFLCTSPEDERNCTTVGDFSTCSLV